MIRPFLVLGTGRCGTRSMSHILNACVGVETVQDGFLLPWEGCPSLGPLVEWLVGGGCRGHIGHNIFPHLDRLHEQVPGLRTVCLHRDRASTVESHMVANGGRCIMWPRQRRGDNNPNRPFYPALPAQNQKECYGFWWDLVESYLASVQSPVFHMDMSSLIDDGELERLGDFLDIAAGDRQWPSQRQWGAQ